MKFTDGFWRIRDGVQISYATEVRDVRAESKRFTSYASTKQVTRRGDTLNAPLVTVDCFSPPRASSACGSPITPGSASPGRTSRWPRRRRWARCAGTARSRS